MPKDTSAAEYRKKNNTELLADLKKLREELQTIRFTKVTGTAVSKLSKIKGLSTEYLVLKYHTLALLLFRAGVP